MSDQIKFDITTLKSHEPLVEYPWYAEVDRLLNWAKDKDSHVRAFCFDLVMSLAYVDATSGLENNIEFCKNTPAEYNSHLSFINLCAPCFEQEDKWLYQKATKPQSGALGKLSSEVILRFIKILSINLKNVLAVGGTDSLDAILIHDDGTTILAEVKSAPLITYPIIFKFKADKKHAEHTKLTITSSQLRACESAVYVHNNEHIPLGRVDGKLWPFKQAVEFVINPDNSVKISKFIDTWLQAKAAYSDRDKKNRMYYLANASGNPPRIAKERDSWPKNESISDGKTSAGMDRTDDIKKGIYQVLKIGAHYKNTENKPYKTAIISNLPAYRHREEYVKPFIDMLWGMEADVEKTDFYHGIPYSKLRRVFDFIITLEEPVLREFEL